MKKVLSALFTVVVLVALVVTPVPVGYAASPAQECAEAGGSYVAAGSESTCTVPGEPVGNSDNTKGGSQTSGPGKWEPNKEETTCTGVNNKPHSCP